jgi:hypothetical protein
MTKLIALVAVCMLGGVARAECPKDSSKEKVAFHYEIIKGKKTMVIDGKPIVVCGHPAKPAVAYVTAPKEIDYHWLSLDQSFVPKIVEATKSAPLTGGAR